MCAHCTDPNHEAPTRADLDEGTADLLAHDARKHATNPHDVQTCTVTGCWVCRTWRRDEKARVDQSIERRTA